MSDTGSEQICLNSSLSEDKDEMVIEEQSVINRRASSLLLLL